MFLIYINAMQEFLILPVYKHPVWDLIFNSTWLMLKPIFKSRKNIFMHIYKAQIYWFISYSTWLILKPVFKSNTNSYFCIFMNAWSVVLWIYSK